MDYTFPRLLTEQYEKYGNTSTAMLEKYRGIWQTYTWKDYYENVKYFSLGLISIGLKKGDRVSILGENQPEWYWADLAVLSARGMVVGVFSDCMPQEVKYYVQYSDSRFVLAQDQEQVDKILAIKDELPQVEKVIYWDAKGLWFYNVPYLMSFDEVIKLGREYEKSHAELFSTNVKEASGDEPALMLFTSGTTGLPKAAMISHNNVIKPLKAMLNENPAYDTDYYFSAISPAWISEHGTIASHLLCAGTVCFPESPETVQEDMREISPQTLSMGARQLESISREIQAKIVDTSFIKRFLYNLFIPVAYKKADMEIAGREMNFLWKLIYGLGDFIVYRNLKDKFGMLKQRRAPCGGAALSPDIIRYFLGIGVRIYIGYGSSEGGVIATSHKINNIKLETAGTPNENIEIRLDDNGHLQMRGPGIFLGYYKNDEATAKAVINGWYQTGDFCHVDEDGHLIVMGRMSDVRELSSGKIFAPDYCEIRLRFSPFIKDCLVFGRKTEAYVTAVINMAMDNVGRWAEARHIAYTTFTDLSQKPEVLDLIEREVKKVNLTLPEHARIKKFVNLHKELDADESELTRTRKLRRSFVEQRLKDIIDGLYSGESEIKVETEIKYRDGRKGTIETSLSVKTIK